MKPLRLIADDLTGALDSACAFALASWPVKVAIPGLPLPEGPSVAVSTESREMARVDAVQSVATIVAKLRAPDTNTIWFKKIDSVMRGNPVAEIGAMLRSGYFDHCVLAPAYPAMGRITVADRQYLLRADGELLAVGPNFRTALNEIGLSAELVDEAAADVTPGNGAAIQIVEACEQEELRRRISAIAALPEVRRLWAGSGGLAMALAGQKAPISFPPISAFIVGTGHPVAREQASRLRQEHLIGHAPSTALAPLLLAPALNTDDVFEGERELQSALQVLHFPEPDRTSILVTGGATLTTTLQSTAAQCLECIGEAVPGVAVSRILGGRWHGITLLSKSGGFGSPSLFLDLLRLGHSNPRDGRGQAHSYGGID
ncbi:uncharacterized protein YgbK (DUF1537 family) [Phyllobacterium trifolii]|uniref:Uncharacterized protein YgbK (DUF1537 family) n=1 Tax=Phyllobacterium trifolii TaxID=300193 RepID=A0A839U6Y1_9HYPH|nr:four-carbon acid sugar kinase family protein [Phyllobacterium trifolii]MBB3146896.1 uncharacterized protein YgbK (DUF1537 family) [Phyllobacterium trifolii]